MESLLRQSRAMCPFLNKTSPATLRSLSTSTAVHQAAPGGGMMSNLQIVARRCPVMGKALALQSARSGNSFLAGAYGGTRAYHSKVARANLHTTQRQDARPLEPERTRADYGRSSAVFCSCSMGHTDSISPGHYGMPTQPAVPRHEGSGTVHGSAPAPPKTPRFDYDAFYQNELDKKHKDKSYRYFNNINRLAKEFPPVSYTHLTLPTKRIV